jgi:hypothetical protein
MEASNYLDRRGILSPSVSLPSIPLVNPLLTHLFGGPKPSPTPGNDNSDTPPSPPENSDPNAPPPPPKNNNLNTSTPPPPETIVRILRPGVIIRLPRLHHSRIPRSLPLLPPLTQERAMGPRTGAQPPLRTLEVATPKSPILTHLLPPPISTSQAPAHRIPPTHPPSVYCHPPSSVGYPRMVLYTSPDPTHRTPTPTILPIVQTTREMRLSLPSLA